jgi:hypothetical protein
MPQRTLRTLLTACALAAALLVCLPGPVHAVPRVVTVDGWEMVWKWVWKLWGGGGEKSGSGIDPNGQPVPSGSGIDPNGGTSPSGGATDPNGDNAQGLSGSLTDLNEGK